MNHILRSSCVAVFLWTAASLSSVVDGASLRPSFLKKKAYTPLLFFTAPKGTLDECDNMESIIKALEKEQGIDVQRLDVMRDRAAQQLYLKLVEGNLRSATSSFPLLYHRESLQRVYGAADADLVRSWCKGRLLAPDTQTGEEQAKEAVALGAGVGADDEEEDPLDAEQLEMELDAELTPMQRRGKEAMKRRMEQSRKK